MNKDKELEEAIKRLDKLIELRKNKCGEIKFDSCICETRDLETVLQALNNFIFVIEEMTQALENSQEECGQYREFIAVTGRKDVDDITATKYVRIQREGYLRGRKEEQEKAKQFIEENSIPKKKIEDKKNKIHEEYINILSEYGNIDTDISFDIPNKNVRKHLDELMLEIMLLQELLEDK